MLAASITFTNDTNAWPSPRVFQNIVIKVEETLRELINGRFTAVWS